MARRYRRYRRYRRTYYRRKRWTAYATECNVGSSVTQIPASNWREYTAGCIYGSSNSLESNATAASPISSINYYVTRCRYKGILPDTSDRDVSYIVYIAYVPNAVVVLDTATQNTGLATSFFYKHPEYILAWTRVDYIADTGDTGEISLYSRVTKRLAPGDRIVVGQLVRNTSSNTAKDVSALTGTFSCYLRTN